MVKSRKSSVIQMGEGNLMNKKVLVLTLSVFFVMLFSGVAMALPSMSADGVTCTPCHTDGRTGDAPAEEPAPAEPAAPAEEPALAEEAAPATKSSDGIKQTRKFAYGDKVVTIDAVNKDGHLYVNAADFNSLVGANATGDLVPFRETAGDLGYTIEYKAGTVYIYGGSADAAGVNVGLSPAYALEGYVGSDTCLNCHADKKEWMTTDHSTMAQNMDDPNAFIMADFRTNTFFEKEDALYAIAQGKRFVGLREGKLQYLNATWNPEAGVWEEGSFRDYSCAGCHNTGFNEETGAWAETGVGCEACHGAGEAHATSADPSKISVSLDVDSCQPCHDEGSHTQVTELMADAEAEAADDAAVMSHLNVLKDSKTAEGGHYGDSCIQCHSAEYRLAYEEAIADGETPEEAIEGLPTAEEILAGDRIGITCVVCHDPHTKTGNIFQLKDPVTPVYVVEEGLDEEAWFEGFEMPSKLCVSCHTAEHALPEHAAKGESPHHPQREWFVGKVPGIESAVPAPNSHECATCHMPNGNHAFETGQPIYTYDSHGHEVNMDVCGSCHADNDLTAEKIEQIKADTQTAIEELTASYSQYADVIDAASEEAQQLYNDNMYNIKLLDGEGSYGIHNNELTEDIIKKAEADLVTLEGLL